MSKTRVYLVSFSRGGRKGGLGLLAIWWTELVRMLSSEMSISDTSLTLSMSSASELFKI